MTQPDLSASRRKRIVGYILLSIGMLTGLAEILWGHYSIYARISRDLLRWLVEGSVTAASIVLMLTGYRLIGGRWRVRDECFYVNLRQRMRLVSLFLLLGYPFFLVLFVTQLYAVLWVTYWFFAFPAGIAILVISFVVGRRKKKQNEAA